MLFVVLFVVVLSAVYFMIGITLWLAALMVLPGLLLTAIVIRGAKNENS
jgi:hypothetical protein